MGNAEFGLSEEEINGFKAWVQSQNKRPYMWDARQWFRDSYHNNDEPDASLDKTLGSLIDEAIEDAVNEMKIRNKVVLIFVHCFDVATLNIH